MPGRKRGATVELQEIPRKSEQKHYHELSVKVKLKAGTERLITRLILGRAKRKADWN